MNFENDIYYTDTRVLGNGKRYHHTYKNIKKVEIQIETIQILNIYCAMEKILTEEIL